MQKRNKFYRVGMRLGQGDSNLHIVYIKAVRRFFKEKIEWPLAFIIMVIVFLSFLSLVIVLDDWFSYSVANNKSYMKEYVELLRGDRKQDILLDSKGG